MVTMKGEIVGLEMDEGVARQYVNEINEHLERAEDHLGAARRKLYALKDRCGWKVLGYTSWRQCVLAEFEQNVSTIYRQLDAALVELELSPNGQQVGEISERVLRPLTKRNFNAEAKQAIWAISQEIVGAGGKITSGITEAVVEGLEDMLRSGAAQDGDGQQHIITELMHADLVARVREKKIAHKQHIQRMDKQRDYILGGGKARIAHDQLGAGIVAALVQVDGLQREKLVEALRLGKPIFASLWTED